MPEARSWKFSLEPEYNFCTFSHRPTKESVALDVGPDAVGELVFEDLMRWVVPGRGCGRWQRWLELDPSPRGTWMAIEALRDPGVLEEVVFALETDFFGYRLLEEAMQHWSTVISYLKQRRSPATRVWVAALTGDWLAARDWLPDSVDRTTSDLVHERAEQCLDQRKGRLQSKIELVSRDHGTRTS